MITFQTFVERNSFRFVQVQRNEFRSTGFRLASAHASALATRRINVKAVALL